MLDSVNVCFHKRVMEVARTTGRTPTVAQAAAGLSLVVSQNVDRFPLGREGRLHTHPSNATYYLYDQHRILRCHATMRLMGCPSARIIGAMSDRELRLMAGDAFSAPTAATMNGACYLNPYAPWWR